MSSYQFVNTLTSCYGQPRPGQTLSLDGNGSAGGSFGNPSDYYSSQAAYANSCYGSAAAAAAAQAAGPSSPAAYAGYLTQNGDHHSHHSHHSHHPSGLNAYPGQVQSRLSHSSSTVVGGSASVPNRTPTPSSCKYGPVDSASSPQDLSTSSTGAGQSSEGSRSSPAAAVPSQSSGRGGSGGATSSANQSSSSTNENNSSSSGKGGQPQIYPWMRKVHVGQSKFAKSKSHVSQAFLIQFLSMSCLFYSSCCLIHLRLFILFFPTSPASLFHSISFILCQFLSLFFHTLLLHIFPGSCLFMQKTKNMADRQSNLPRNFPVNLVDVHVQGFIFSCCWCCCVA